MNTLLNTLLKQYKLYPSNILALGDEELGSLTQRGDDQQTRGIVSTRDIVASGKESNPVAKLYAHKLEAYRIAGMMQLTYALHGQLNMIDNKRRDKLLETIVKHSAPYGLVVLDMKLPAYYESITKQDNTTQISDRQVILSSWTSKKNSYTHHQLQFTQVDGQEELYHRIQQSQQHYTMPVSDLKKLCLSYFESVTILDIKGRKLTKNNNHVLVVCQMGGPERKPKIVGV